MPVTLSVYLSSTLDWPHAQTGAFLAFWIISYGIIQASAPGLFRNKPVSGNTAISWTFILATVPAAIAI